MSPNKKTCLDLTNTPIKFFLNSKSYNRYLKKSCTHSVDKEWKNLICFLSNIQVLSQIIQNDIKEILAWPAYEKLLETYFAAKHKIQLEDSLLESLELSRNPTKNASSEHGISTDDYKLVGDSLDCSIVRKRLVDSTGNGCFRAAKPLAIQALIVFLIPPLLLALSCYLGSFLKQAVIDLKVEKKKEGLKLQEAATTTRNLNTDAFRTIQNEVLTPNEKLPMVLDSKKGC